MGVLNACYGMDWTFLMERSVPTGIGKSFSISTIYYYDAYACMCYIVYTNLENHQIFTLST